MDEMTHRIALQIPDDMLEFLAMIAKREGFETRKTGRAIRWCIREAQKRDEAENLKALQAEIAIAGGPPETVSALENFLRPIEQLIKGTSLDPKRAPASESEA
jgi:hypothetical protein